jgi:hypothetical protein
MSDQPRLPWWRTRGGIAAIGFALVVALFVLREHSAHALGQLHYSDLAIATVLTLQVVFRPALRQIEGLISSILHLLGLGHAAWFGHSHGLPSGAPG